MDNEDPLGHVDRSAILTTQGPMLTQHDVTGFNISENNLVNNSLQQKKTNSFETSLPPRRNSNSEDNQILAIQDLTPLMQSLKRAIEADSQSQLISLAQSHTRPI